MPPPPPNLPRQLQQLLDHELEQLPDQPAPPNPAAGPALCVRGDHNTVVYAPNAAAPIHITTRDAQASRCSAG